MGASRRVQSAIANSANSIRASNLPKTIFIPTSLCAFQRMQSSFSHLPFIKMATTALSKHIIKQRKESFSPTVHELLLKKTSNACTYREFVTFIDLEVSNNSTLIQCPAENWHIWVQTNIRSSHPI